jgi:hypothetical protein
MMMHDGPVPRLVVNLPPTRGACEQPSIKLAVRNVLIEMNPLDGRPADVPSYPAVFQLKDLRVACLPILLCFPKSPEIHIRELSTWSRAESCPPTPECTLADGPAASLKLYRTSHRATMEPKANMKSMW